MITYHNKSFSQTKKEKCLDYEIINKVILQTIQDSSETYFICNANFQESSKGSFYKRLMSMANAINLKEEFSNYNLNSTSKRLERRKWKKKKIDYKYIADKEEEDKMYFMISSPVYSKTKRYFFMIVDHDTHSAAAIFERMDDGSIKILNEKRTRLKTPFLH